MPGYTLDIEKLARLIAGEYPSLRKAAKDMGINHSYLSKVLTGKREPGRKFISGIMTAFASKKIKLEDLFKKQND